MLERVWPDLTPAQRKRFDQLNAELDCHIPLMARDVRPSWWSPSMLAKQ
jgi:hypothetical protein